ncbi:MAG: hypothetical protein J3K34DRAFT_255264 [Monoraphidium minutum]|nr:MAG: hypothetical protein J3K34DRAFT_255264 [Monoraphidium minutum]
MQRPRRGGARRGQWGAGGRQRGAGRCAWGPPGLMSRNNKDSGGGVLNKSGGGGGGECSIREGKGGEPRCVAAGGASCRRPRARFGGPGGEGGRRRGASLTQDPNGVDPGGGGPAQPAAAPRPPRGPRPGAAEGWRGRAPRRICARGAAPRGHGRGRPGGSRLRPTTPEGPMPRSDMEATRREAPRAGAAGANRERRRAGRYPARGGHTARATHGRNPGDGV